MKARWLGIPAAAILMMGLGQSAHADAETEAKARALAKKSGCFACHSIEKKVVGPSWKDIAARYKGDTGARATLITKVRKGGKGNWGAITGGVPMPPYSPRVTEGDIETLVDFIINL